MPMLIAWIVGIFTGKTKAERNERRAWLRGEIPSVPEITERQQETGDTYAWRQ